MDESRNITVGCGPISFPSALTLLFIGLKLGGVIDWSWIWVLAPMWISMGLGLLIIFLVCLVVLLIAWFAD